jgi:succinoglycan biosynthesis transport protein ExoP
MEAPKFNHNNGAGSPSSNNSATSESKLHFLDYWRIIRIRKTVILAVFLLVVLTTTAVTFILPESFMSTARIEVSKDTSDIPLLLQMGQQGGYDPYFIETEFQKIKSTKVLEQVIENLNLNQVWGKRYGIDNLKTSETYEILKKQIDLRQSRNTSLIEINAYSENKEEAAKLANEIATVYQQSRLQAKSGQSEAGITALKKEMEIQNEKVDEVQKKVDSIRQQLKIADVGDSQFQMTLEPETVRNIERDRIRADEEYTQLNTLYGKLKELSRADLRKAIPTAFRDEAMDRYLADLAKSEQQYAIASVDYGPENPEVHRLTSVISNINQQIETRIDGVLRGLEIRVTSARTTADFLKKQVEDAKELDAKKMEEYRPYFKLRRDLETQQRLRENIFIRVLQETVDKNIPKSSLVEIVDPAKVPQKAVRPNIPLNITLGVVVGLIMGFGLAFFIEYLDTSVKTIDDVERTLQAPVIGVIPQNVGSLISEGPDSPHAEAYRVLRTNMLFARKDPKDSTITVVSGGAGEGKSTTIFNLATIFAQNGHRVLLVDSDLRRPSLHKLLNVSNSMGLTNYLLKQNTMDEVIQTTPTPLLNFLPSGKLPSSSLGILNSAQMREFIRQAKERYDFVFFDSPPIMGVSDASILASEVDMALLVIQYRKYPQVMTIRAKQMVEKVGGNLLGVVLNNINISQDSYYYYYSGYYYDYYSKHDDEEKSAEGASKKGKGDRAAVDIKRKF